jgi:hypothetical protein
MLCGRVRKCLLSTRVSVRHNVESKRQMRMQLDRTRLIAISLQLIDGPCGATIQQTGPAFRS